MNSSDFPNKIDLAMSPPSMPLDATSPKGKKTPPKPMYPSLYISGVDGLEGMPKEGYAMIYFKRRSVTIGEGDEGDPKHSADLEIQEICLPNTTPEEEEMDMKDAMKSVAKKAGIDTGEEDENPEEEAMETEDEEAAELEDDEEE